MGTFISNHTVAVLGSVSTYFSRLTAVFHLVAIHARLEATQTLTQMVSRIQNVATCGNSKSQNPLHLLATHGAANAAAIFECFLAAIPSYPLNNLDENGCSGNEEWVLAMRLRSTFVFSFMHSLHIGAVSSQVHFRIEGFCYKVVNILMKMFFLLATEAKSSTVLFCSCAVLFSSYVVVLFVCCFAPMFVCCLFVFC